MPCNSAFPSHILEKVPELFSVFISIPENCVNSLRMFLTEFKDLWLVFEKKEDAISVH